MPFGGKESTWTLFCQPITSVTKGMDCILFTWNRSEPELIELSRVNRRPMDPVQFADRIRLELVTYKHGLNCV